MKQNSKDAAKIEEQYREILGRLGTKGVAALPILQEMQDTFGYIPEEGVRWFSEQLDIPQSSFYGIATFYEEFHLKPRGKHIITACCDTACYVKGAENLIMRFRSALEIPDGEDTTGDGTFTVQKGSCVGACSIAPVVTVDRKTFGNVSPDEVGEILKDYGDRD